MTNRFFFWDDGTIKGVESPIKPFVLDDHFQGEGRMNRDKEDEGMSIEEELDFVKFSSAYLTDEERVRQEYRLIGLIIKSIRKKHC